MKEKSPQDENVRVAVFGRLCVRCILHLLGKEKLGREPDGFKGGLEEIGNKFAQELTNPRMKLDGVKGSKNDELKIENLVDAKPADVALVQNDHLKIGMMHFGLAKYC